MASMSIAMALPVTKMGQRSPMAGISDALGLHIRIIPKACKTSSQISTRRFEVKASSAIKEKVVTGLTTAALVAALVVPDIAEAAQPGVSPSLKNFLLSILSGGVVLTVIIGAVIGVSNFDPVKRG